MKRRMIWIFLAGALVGIVLSGLYKHFVTDQIMDGGNGMENPDQNLFLLDGDGTYVDNSLLWPVLEGTWESPEDGWQAVISEEDGLTLRLDGETVLETPLDFTYIPRKKIQDTGLMLDNRVLQKADGTEWGKILDVYHCAGAGEDSGRLELTVPAASGLYAEKGLFPNIRFAPRNGKYFDFSEAGVLAAEVENLSPYPIDIVLEIQGSCLTGAKHSRKAASR